MQLVLEYQQKLKIIYRYYPSDIQTNLFERSFSRSFTKHIDSQKRNDNISYNFEKLDITDRTPFSEEGFVKKTII